jgi:hypothetical protein
MVLSRSCRLVLLCPKTNFSFIGDANNIARTFTFDDLMRLVVV